MQPRPTADELLAAVAQVLDDEVVPALGGPLQHHARVAANLVGIVERELRLGPAAAARERDLLQELLGTAEPEVAELRARLAADLRSGWADDPAVARRVWPVLLAVVRDDLAVAKPGHDAWEGE